MGHETLQITSDLIDTELEFVNGSIVDIEAQMVMQPRLTTEQLGALLDLHCAYAELRSLLHKAQPLFRRKQDGSRMELNRLIAWPHYRDEC
jgi:hypothetical protein